MQFRDAYVKQFVYFEVEGNILYNVGNQVMNVPSDVGETA